MCIIQILIIIETRSTKKMKKISQKDIIELMNNHNYNDDIVVSFFKGIDEVRYRKRYHCYINYVYKCYPNARIYEHRDFASSNKYGVTGAIDRIDIFDINKGHISLLIGYVNKQTSKYFK